MTQATNKNVPADARKRRHRWYSHLLIFVIAQIAFFIFDTYSHWVIFNLSPLGEWVEANLGHRWEWFQIYEVPMFNLLTVVWGIVLIIYGITSFYYTIFSKKGKSPAS